MASQKHLTDHGVTQDAGLDGPSLVESNRTLVFLRSYEVARCNAAMYKAKKAVREVFGLAGFCTDKSAANPQAVTETLPQISVP